MSSSLIQLECGCNNYPWGKKGKDSLAAKYAASTPGGSFKLDESKEYAEMWCGTYPTTPSKILSSGEDLQQHLNANKEKLIGPSILKKFGADLPYLPKILSIAKALPLQIHPDKDLAAKLHKQDPEKYGDSNHKPEIAVALSKFEVFVGFLPLEQIQKLFTTIPVLKSKYPISGTLDKEKLRDIVAKLLGSSDEEIVSTYKKLRGIDKSVFGDHAYIVDLLPRLAEQYEKSDPGNLVALLTMNYLVLEKGDVIYVPADGIHAYLSGDIVECMARSDNVLNTGFCPRADRDSVELFSKAITFSPNSASEAILKPEQSPKGIFGKTKVLAPPMSEFNMLVTRIGKKDKETIKAIDGPSVILVTEGKGTLAAVGNVKSVEEGYVFFLGQGTELMVASDEGLELHIAYCEA